MKKCTRHSNSVPGGALRVLATQATLNGSSRKPGSQAPRSAARGREAVEDGRLRSLVCVFMDHPG
ncbi:MAG: hypothetical protein QF903_10180 [Planctomycetota bacterium]|nr:hypothetical protein [Planctomycetota bacterium]MDP6989834.1 hypothetical protein [Planctomycetota bacterium]